MIAVGLSEESAAEVISEAGFQNNIDVACINSLETVDISMDLSLKPIRKLLMRVFSSLELS